MLPSSVELYNLAEDPSESVNLADKHPEKVAELQRRIEALAKQATRPLFLIDQFKVITRNMQGEPLLPIDEDFAAFEQP